MDKIRCTPKHRAGVELLPDNIFHATLIQQMEATIFTYSIHEKLPVVLKFSGKWKGMYICPGMPNRNIYNGIFCCRSQASISICYF